MARGKTRGIVLRKIDYSETSIILQVLTPTEGVKSFIFQGAKRKKKKGNIISSLALISIEFYQRGDSDMAKISAVEPLVIYNTITFDPYKTVYYPHLTLPTIYRYKAVSQVMIII